MILPTIGILLLTYKRTDYAISTIQALNKNLRYGGDLMWYVADDGSPEDHVSAIDSLVKSTMDNYLGWHSRKSGYGENATRGWDALLKFCDTVLFLEDDWVLERELNISPYMDLLINNDRIGMVRMGYLNVNMQGKAFGHNGKLYWELDRNADPYVCTGHPCLRHRRFRDAYGTIPSGLNPGDTELAYAMQYRYNPGPEIVWPAELGEGNWFGHVGEVKSY